MKDKAGNSNRAGRHGYNAVQTFYSELKTAVMVWHHRLLPQWLAALPLCNCLLSAVVSLVSEQGSTRTIIQVSSLKVPFGMWMSGYNFFCAWLGLHPIALAHIPLLDLSSAPAPLSLPPDPAPQTLLPRSPTK